MIGAGVHCVVRSCCVFPAALELSMPAAHAPTTSRLLKNDPQRRIFLFLYRIGVSCCALGDLKFAIRVGPTSRFSRFGQSVGANLAMRNRL